MGQCLSLDLPRFLQRKHTQRDSGASHHDNNCNNQIRQHDRRTPNVEFDCGYIVCATHDYEAREEGDLGFFKGDQMRVISRDIPNADGWWKAEHLERKVTGLIPSNFVVELEESGNIEKQDWWFDIERRDANKLLAIPGIARASFLIRRSKAANQLALSIRNFDDSNEECDVKHYQIQFDTRDSKYFIQRARRFDKLQELVSHYQSSADGLCCTLSVPCPKETEMIPFKDLQVKRSDVKLIEKIGSGKFGEVWKGKYKHKLDVAVKKMLPGKMTSEEFLAEAKMMHRVHNRRLVQLLGVCSLDDPILIITELIEHGSLLNHLRDDKGQTIMFKDILDYAAQIAEGMEYLERKNYIHCDLRAANILIGTGKNIKVADFGLARVLFGEVYILSKESQFPIRWTAPEACLYQTFTIKSDVWSYGIVLYELVTFGQHPYTGLSTFEVMEKIKVGYRLPNPESKCVRRIECPDEMYSMMLKCWDDVPEARPTFTFLREYFDNYYNETETPYVENETDN